MLSASSKPPSRRIPISYCLPCQGIEVPARSSNRGNQAWIARPTANLTSAAPMEADQWTFNSGESSNSQGSSMQPFCTPEK